MADASPRTSTKEAASPGPAVTGSDEMPLPFVSIYTPLLDGRVGIGIAAHGLKACANAAVGVLTIGTEMLRFASHRAKKEAETGQHMSRCRSPAELYSTQSAFMEQTLHDYAAETSKMAALLTAAAQEAVTPLTSETAGLLQRIEEIPSDNGHFV